MNIPQFCTNTSVALINNNNAIITFFYSEHDYDFTLARIAIDLEHMTSLRDTLSAILDEATND